MAAHNVCHWYCCTATQVHWAAPPMHSACSKLITCNLPRSLSHTDQLPDRGWRSAHGQAPPASSAAPWWVRAHARAHALLCGDWLSGDLLLDQPSRASAQVVQPGSSCLQDAWQDELPYACLGQSQAMRKPLEARPCTQIARFSEASVEMSINTAECWQGPGLRPTAGTAQPLCLLLVQTRTDAFPACCLRPCA